MIEAARPDVLLSEARVNRLGIAVAREAEQRCAADDIETARAQHSIKLACLLIQPLARRNDPLPIGQRGAADDERGPRHRPGSERCGDLGSQISLRNREAEAQSSKAKKLSERAQHDDRKLAAQLDRAAIGRDIGKGFIDDEAAAASAKLARGGCDDAARLMMRPSGLLGLTTTAWVTPDGSASRPMESHLASGASERGSVLAVGRPDDCDGTAGHHVRQHLDQRLGARGDRDIGAGGNVISYPCRFDQVAFGRALRQALPRPRRKFRRHIGTARG